MKPKKCKYCKRAQSFVSGGCCKKKREIIAALKKEAGHKEHQSGGCESTSSHWAHSVFRDVVK